MAEDRRPVGLYRQLKEIWSRLEEGGAGGIGPKGDKGDTGATGPQGPIGETGPAGAAGNNGVAGPKGDTGPQGIPGNDGAPGAQGATGPAGDTGPAGPAGEAGPQGPPGNDGAAGPQGIAGDTGPQGDAGPQGQAGPQGIKGDTGDVGEQGPQGIQGVKGDTGDTGPQGIPGVGADPWTYLKLANDFTTSSGTAVDITGLAFTPVLNTQYEFEACLFMRTATATVGPRPGIAWPGGTSDSVGDVYATSAAAAEIQAHGNANAALQAVNTGLPSTTLSFSGRAYGSFRTGASPTGTLKLQLASETAGTNAVAKAGSFLKYRMI